MKAFHIIAVQPTLYNMTFLRALIVCFLLISCQKEDDTLPAPPPSLPTDNILLGNPSNATTEILNASNYLLYKEQYSLSYNNTTHLPNWVSWHLQKGDLGNIDRQDDFCIDNTLPASFYKVTPNDFTGSGFDRGHLCPSADRTLTNENNTATFLMTNIIPQSPDNNRYVWVELENYCRNMATNNNELYVIAGPYGKGGTGSKGLTNTLQCGIVVPAYVWKIIVILPQGNNDLERIDANTRIISVLMPNNQNSDQHPWTDYRVNVNYIEELTGFDFLNNLHPDIQEVLEARVDHLN
jgi:endonuclease G